MSFTLLIVISQEETAAHLIFSFTSECNPLVIRLVIVTKATTFKATALTYFIFSVGIEKVP